MLMPVPFHTAATSVIFEFYYLVDSLVTLLLSLDYPTLILFLRNAEIMASDQHLQWLLLRLLQPQLQQQAYNVDRGLDRLVNSYSISFY